MKLEKYQLKTLYEILDTNIKALEESDKEELTIKLKNELEVSKEIKDIITQSLKSGKQIKTSLDLLSKYKKCKSKIPFSIDRLKDEVYEYKLKDMYSWAIKSNGQQIFIIDYYPNNDINKVEISTERKSILLTPNTIEKLKYIYDNLEKEMEDMEN